MSPRLPPSCGCLLCLLLLVSCTLPGSTLPTFKIGLVAPFEGHFRAVGYDAIYAARLAVRQANRDLEGYRVELIAYDDGGDPEVAARQARMLALDPAVIGVIGHFRADTTRAAIPIYSRERMPLLVPANVPAQGSSSSLAVINLGPTTVQLENALAAYLEISASISITASALAAGQSLAELREGGWRGEFAGGPELAQANFAAVAKSAGAGIEGVAFVTGAPWPQDVPGAEQLVVDYTAVSGGTPPGPYAWAAYQATQILLEAARRDIQANQAPSHSRVAAQLQAIQAEEGFPLSEGAAVYLYRYDATGRAVLLK